MKLPIPRFSKKDPPAEDVRPVFAMWISTTHIQSGIWQPDPQKLLAPTLLASSRLFSIAWQDQDNRLKVIDEALSDGASQSGINSSEPSEVLLGLPGTWVHQGQLQTTYRQLLKQITEGLELKPMGFVVTSEAMLHTANQSLGVTNGLVLGVGKLWLEVGLAVQGQMNQLLCFEYTQTLGIKEILAAISQLDQGHLPPKILLWGDDHNFLLSIQQLLSQHPWQEEPLAFMHIPSVELIAYQALDGIIYSVTAHYETVPPLSQPNALPAATSEVLSSAHAAEPVLETIGSGQTHDIGVIGTSLHEAETSFSHEEPASSSIKETEDQPLLTYGFVRDADIREITTDARTVLATQTIPVPSATHVTASVAEIQEGEPEDVEDLSEDISEVAVSEFSEESTSLKKKPSSQAMRRMTRWLLWIVLLLLLIAGIGGGSIWGLQRYSKAEVTLQLMTQPLEQTFEITIDPELPSENITEGTFKGELLTVRVEGDETTEATGKDKVGEKATGEITIFNDTDTARTLPAGTKLLSNDKKFTFLLDSSVSIASKSVDLSSDSPFSPGKAVAKVTAEKIGAEYNLAAQTAFSVANFSGSVLLGRNDKTFSGGTSQEVTVVTKQDRQKALDTLTKSLRALALEKAQAESSGITIIADSGTFSWTEQSLTKKVGEQSDKVTAQGILEYTLVGYDPQEFEEFARMKLSAAVPDGKTLTQEIATSFSQKEASDSGIYIFTVVASGTLKTEIPTDKILARLLGATADDVDGYLDNLPGVAEATYTISPRLPAPFNRFPSDASRITLTIEE